RSDRKEAVLSCAAGIGHINVRHARLRPALRLLSELVDLASVARRLCRLTSQPGHRRQTGGHGQGLRRINGWVKLQRTADYRGMGRRSFQEGKARRISHRFHLKWECDAPGPRLP